MLPMGLVILTGCNGGLQSPCHRPKLLLHEQERQHKKGFKQSNCKLLTKKSQNLAFLSKTISSVTIERTPTIISEFTLTHNSSSKYTLCLFPSQKSTCLWHLEFVLVKCPGVLIFVSTVRGQRQREESTPACRQWEDFLCKL